MGLLGQERGMGDESRHAGEARETLKKQDIGYRGEVTEPLAEHR